jgi:glycine/D-amino acid oxidase-like deaminating enzyme
VAGEARPSIERSCYWLAAHPRKADPPLEGSRDADVAIVGAGLTGLWTASFLKALEPALDAVVVEQQPPPMAPAAATPACSGSWSSAASPATWSARGRCTWR